MLTLPPSVKIHLAVGPTDLRKSIDGLMAIVRNHWQSDPFSGHLHVFLSRDRSRAKILFWDQGGFVVYYKRLERGRFRMPAVDETQQKVRLDATDLAMLLQGIDTGRVRRPRPWEPRQSAA
jgi:transposase